MRFDFVSSSSERVFSQRPGVAGEVNLFNASFSPDSTPTLIAQTPQIALGDRERIDSEEQESPSQRHIPLFESTSSGALARYTPTVADLPARAGETAVFPHPTLDYEIRITRVSTYATAIAAFGSEDVNVTKNEYAMHSPWDASGHYLITHGGSMGRLLYDGRDYSVIRALRVGEMRDFQWSPTQPGVGYYFDRSPAALMEYNAATDSHRTVLAMSGLSINLDAGGTATNLSFTGGFASPMGGAGSISADGAMIAFRADSGADAIVMAVELPGGNVAHALRVVNGAGQPSKSRSAALDRVGVAPDKSGVAFSFKHAGHNGAGPYVGGPAVNTHPGEGDWRFYPFTDFRIASDDSSVSLNPEADHSDMGFATDGTAITVEDRGEFHNLKTGQKIGNIWTPAIYASTGTAYPATHVAFPDDGAPFVILSGYASSTISNPPMLAFKAEAGGDVAWLGNANVCDTHNYHNSEPHAALRTNVEYADGIVGWKVAFTSDNNACAHSGNGYRNAQAAASGGLFVAEIWRTKQD
ncbi:MAG: hypothetical protein AAGA11_21690 [Pseudomonadota bacterium]